MDLQCNGRRWASEVTATAALCLAEQCAAEFDEPLPGLGIPSDFAVLADPVAVGDSVMSSHGDLLVVCLGIISARTGFARRVCSTHWLHTLPGGAFKCCGAGFRALAVTAVWSWVGRTPDMVRRGPLRWLGAGSTPVRVQPRRLEQPTGWNQMLVRRQLPRLLRCLPAALHRQGLARPLRFSQRGPAARSRLAAPSEPALRLCAPRGIPSIGLTTRSGGRFGRSAVCSAFSMQQSKRVTYSACLRARTY